ncbi:MAG: hypothetical protein R3C68_08685 [Myxococcota bacterium]
MPDYTQILREFTPEKFNEVVLTSARKAREVYFHRHGIRAPKSSGRIVKPGAKNEIRCAELYRVLSEKKDEELAEEILRSWLLTKREMLAAALDHLKIPHDNGLTESDDVKQFEKLKGEHLRGMIAKLNEYAPKEEVVAYLKFMGTDVSDKS